MKFSPFVEFSAPNRLVKKFSKSSYFDGDMTKILLAVKNQKLLKKTIFL
jgi:hypothetical protein